MEWFTEAQQAIHNLIMYTKSNETAALRLKTIKEKLNRVENNDLYHPDDLTPEERISKNRVLLKEHIDKYDIEGNKCKCVTFRHDVKTKGLKYKFPCDYELCIEFFESSACICADR